MKRFLPSRRFGNVLLSSFLVAGTALLAAAPFAAAQQSAPQPPPVATTVALPIAYPTEFDGDLRTLPQTYTPPQYYLLLNEYEEPPNQKPPPGPEAVRTPPSIEMSGPMPSTMANFAGLGFTTAVNGGQAGGGWPPDTNGDVGPTYYIQSVNTAMGVFSKATGALVTSFTINQFWASSGTATICLNQNRGDPVVMHDPRSDRWIITDFAFGITGGKPVAPFYQCIAVSKTGDPVAGGWRFYAVQVDTGASGGPPASTLNDYPKFGLWNDGCLYMGANAFNEPAGSYAGAVLASFSTTDMYAGNALTSSIGFLSYASANEFSLFPADLLGSQAGSMPPAGTPEYFVAESQSIYGLNVRKFTPGANCGAGGTISASTAVPHASYSYNGGHFIAQQGSPTLLDSLEDRVMQRVQYRKIGSAESLWVVHTTGSGPAQPQWVQVNVSGGTITTTPVQQQIYAPDTTKSRWMAALGVDQQGNMAVGYSRSSATDYPSIYYAGRLAGDPLNTLPQSEVALVTGGGGQANNCGGAACYRWGDYSSMTIDPSDDCTFWYTTEYYDTQANGTAGNWQTRIGSFKFPSCGVTYTVGGNAPSNGVLGLTGSNKVSLLLTDTTTSGTQTLSNLGNGTFAFPTGLASGDGWNVTVSAQPTGQTCAVTNGSGASIAANVTNVTVTCTTNTYTLTYTAGANGSISGTSPQTVNYGASGTAVTATPATGYHFVQWSDGVLTAARTDTNVQANISVTATFAINTYTLTYTAGANGSITGSSPQTVNYGASGTAVTATPATGYHFVQWSDASTANPRTDTNVQANISVTATFAINTYTLTYTAGANGSISGTSPQTVNYGASGTAVTATPATGYHFVQWSDGVLTAARTDTNVQANISVTATFAINTYTLTYTAGSNGSISGTSPQTVNYGASGTAVTATPATGYHFVQWSDGVLTAARTDTNVQANISVTATFAINTYTLTYTAGSNGSISGTSPQTVNYGASGTAVTATPATGYHFVQWSDGVLTAARTDTNVTKGISVTATFAINTYTLTYTAGSNGSISGTSPQTVNYGASGTAVTATPATGYHFVQWSDASTANPRTDTNVTADISVTATFAINTYTLTYTAGANGSITGSSPQTVNYGASGTAVTASPGLGYHFVQWSDASTANPRTDTNVTADINVTAAFAANPPAQLVISTVPDGTAGAALSPAVTVTVEDAGGVPVIGDTNSVTLSITSGPGPFDVSSTVTASFVNGVATFSNLILFTAGNYTLSAVDAGDSLNAGPSNTFTISPAAAHLLFTTLPTDVQQGSTQATIAVTEQDQYGNVVTTDSASTVNFTVSACGNPVSLGSALMVSGVATLSNSAQRFYTLASGLKVTATSSGTFSGTVDSSLFNVTTNADFGFSDGFESCRL